MCNCASYCRFNSFVSVDDPTGVLSLKGSINMPLNIKAKGGFVSARTAFTADLQDYHSLELKLKNNINQVVRGSMNICAIYTVTNINLYSLLPVQPIRFTFNMKCQSSIADEMYQSDVEVSVHSCFIQLL